MLQCCAPSTPRNLRNYVHSLPQGPDTLMGERGVRLSGGQRQRIGIARALYHDPAVLVLDEATTSLDATTEREVMQAVRALQGPRLSSSLRTGWARWNIATVCFGWKTGEWWKRANRK